MHDDRPTVNLIFRLSAEPPSKQSASLRLCPFLSNTGRGADENGLDLVEVSPEAKPPVCRLVDYGKFKYQQSKKAQEAKKKQTVIEIKEINLTPNTDRHDIETKQNHIKRWILEKARVRVGIKFRGREMSHMDLGYKVLNELMHDINDIVVQESSPRMEGKRLVVTLLPKGEKI